MIFAKNKISQRDNLKEAIISTSFKLYKLIIFLNNIVIIFLQRVVKEMYIYKNIDNIRKAELKRFYLFNEES